VPFKIICGFADQLNGVAKTAETCIAAVTQQTTNRVCMMIVIHSQKLKALRALGLFANSAHPALSF